MCAQIAGLQDFRQEGPPGDIGTFQAAASIIVYQFTFSGVTYVVAQRMGVRGWNLVDQGTVAVIVINAAITAAPVGCKIFVKYATYNINASIVPKDQCDLIAERGTILQATVANLPNGVISFVKGVDTEMRCKISGFHITGQGYNTDNGVVFLHVYRDIVLEYLTLDGFTAIPVHISGNTWGIKLRNITIDAPVAGYGLDIDGGVNHENTFVSVYISGDGIAVYIYGDALFHQFYDLRVTVSNIHGVFISGDGGTGIPISTGFHECWFEHPIPYGGRAIRLDDVGGHVTKPTLTLIENSHFGGYDRGIWGFYGSLTTIRNNFFITITTFDIQNDPGMSDTTIEGGSYNMGISDTGVHTCYSGPLWRNRVSVTIAAAATSQAFAHGCSYTPAAGDIHPTLTNLPTTPIGDIYVDTIGAVNATLHCTTPPGVATAIFDVSIIRTP